MQLCGRQRDHAGRAPPSGGEAQGHVEGAPLHLRNLVTPRPPGPSWSTLVNLVDFWTRGAGPGHVQAVLLRLQGSIGDGDPQQPVAVPEQRPLRPAGQLPGAVPRHPGAHADGGPVQQAGEGGDRRHQGQGAHQL
eukprot:3784714-Pyramimonas_sp.AAC.1